MFRSNGTGEGICSTGSHLIQVKNRAHAGDRIDPEREKKAVSGDGAWAVVGALCCGCLGDRGHDVLSIARWARRIEGYCPDRDVACHLAVFPIVVSSSVDSRRCRVPKMNQSLSRSFRLALC